MRGGTIYAALLLAAAALFLLVPQLDLWTSGLFYVRGQGFVLAHWPPVVFVFRTIPWLARLLVLLVLGAGAWLLLVGRPLWRFDLKALLFLGLSLAIGPGLLTNTVLKDHWGRARPVQVTAFGGSHLFTPAPLPANQCPTNCSFVSGHAALAFSLVAFGFLLPTGRSRRRGIGAALAFGGLVGLVRIAQGGHFLSDVVFAGFLVFGTTALLHWWIVEHDGLTAPLLLRCYVRLGRGVGHGAALTWPHLRQSWPSPAVRAGVAMAVTTILVVVSIGFIDRPVALFLHARDPDLHALANLTGELGEGWGWLVLFALGFAGLHWGGALPRLRPIAGPMRQLSAIPAFLFVSIAASGLAVDILKIGFGRMRPKLLFRDDLYGFTWFGLRADHWSFPSGHTDTIVTLFSALWWLWPQHLLFYILAAAIVAGSRVVSGAHYPSDVLAGALVAVLTTWYVAAMFARWGIDLTAFGRGRLGAVESPPWPCRRIGAMLAGGRPAADRSGGSLAPPTKGVVSPRDHGAADRDL